MGNSPNKNATDNKNNSSKVINQNNSKKFSKTNIKSDSEYEYYYTEVDGTEEEPEKFENNRKKESSIKSNNQTKYSDSNRGVLLRQVDSEDIIDANYETNEFKSKVFDKHQYMQKIEVKKMEITDALKFAINYNETICNSDLT